MISERDENIYKMSQNSFTRKQIADKYKLSTERIRQIVFRVNSIKRRNSVHSRNIP